MRAVIFDLDGTLTQSDEGIYKSICYAAEKLGFAAPDEADRRKFVGPSLMWSFTELLGMGEEQARQALEAYRERYWKVGLFENRVYPGIRNLLRMLKRRGDWVAIATGKPMEPSRRIMEHFDLSRYFDRIVGPGFGEASAEKEDLIRAALPEVWDEAVMVGDRKFDIEGAAKAVELQLNDEELAYLEASYVPHPLAGVMAQNKPANAKEKHVWSTGDQKIEA